jgi:hypothetical protein
MDPGFWSIVRNQFAAGIPRRQLRIGANSVQVVVAFISGVN